HRRSPRAMLSSQGVVPRTLRRNLGSAGPRQASSLWSVPVIFGVLPHDALYVPTPIAARLRGLVFLAEQIEHRLYRVKGQARDFDEHGVPVRHGAIPKPGQFQSLEVSAVVAFLRAKAVGRVNKTRKFERL